MAGALFLFPHALPELAGLCDYPVEQNAVEIITVWLLRLDNKRQRSFHPALSQDTHHWNLFAML